MTHELQALSAQLSKLSLLADNLIDQGLRMFYAQERLQEKLDVLLAAEKKGARSAA